MDDTEVDAPLTLVASLDSCEHPTMLLHMLAQLPNDTSLTLMSERLRELPEPLSRVARAYGLDGRVYQDVHRQVTGGETFVEVNQRRFVVTEFSGATRHFDTLGEIIEGIGRGRFSEPPQTSGAILSGRRFAIVTNHPAHYRIPLFTRVARLLADRDASLRVFFTAHVPGSRPWLSSRQPLSFDHMNLKAIRLPIRRRRAPSLPLGLAGALRKYAPDVILSAGFSPMLAGPALRVARGSGASLGIWSGEVSHARTAHDRFRRVTRRHLIGAADFALSYGAASAQYLHRMRPDLPTVIARNTSATPRPRERGASDRLRLVAVGDLGDSRKGIDVLIDALALAKGVECEAVVIGGGSQLPSLRARAAGDPRVRFPGALRSSETLEHLARADAFVFPTRFDIFGLSLVEAMGAGLACVVSRSAGGAADLCLQGVNSIVVGGHHPADWAAALERLASDSTLRAELGRRASATIKARWTLDHSASAIVAGLGLGAGMAC